MAKIDLTKGFAIIPEGTHICKITGVRYKEDFGKLEIDMQTQNGYRYTKYYSLLNSDGSINQGAYNHFVYFARTAFNNFDLAVIDHTDLIGHFVECDIEHTTKENKNKPGQNITFAELKDVRPSEGWAGAGNTVTAPTAKTAPAASQMAPKTPMDLAALLG